MQWFSNYFLEEKHAITVDGFVKSPIIVMPDPGSSPGQALISLPRHVVSRGHPEPVEFTGFRLPPE